MLVSDYLSHITKGDVKNLYISDIGTGTPNTTQQENIDILISYINLANLELHKRFALIQKEYILEQLLKISIKAFKSKIQRANQISKNNPSGDGKRQHVTIYKEKRKD